MRKSRIENDAYYTEDGVIDALFKVYPDIARHEKYFDPCAGDCRMIFRVKDLLRESSLEAKTLAADLYLTREGTALWQGFDASLSDHWDEFFRMHQPDVTITNPPFKGAIDILENAILYTNKKVAFLLRLSFLEPCQDRAAFLKEYSDCLVKIVFLSPRPKFRSDTKGSDNVTVAWFVWDKSFSWKALGIDCPFYFMNEWKI